MDLTISPKIKIVLVTNDVTELNEMLEKGWKIASNFPHAEGALFMMAKDRL